MSEDYSDHPVSLAEVRAGKAQQAGAELWTPRDALIRTLRLIDTGELNPTACIIVLSEENDETGTTGFRFMNAIRSTAEGVYLAEVYKHETIAKSG